MSIAFLLIGRKSENTGEIVIFTGFFILWTRRMTREDVRGKESDLGEISDNVKSLGVEFCENVEHEWICVVIQSFVIEKEFRQETHLMSISFVLSTIDFEEWNCSMTIDFISRRMGQCTLRLDGDKYPLLLSFSLLSFTRCRFNASVSWQYFKQNSQM